jgi:hypothetical protein
MRSVRISALSLFLAALSLSTQEAPAQANSVMVLGGALTDSNFPSITNFPWFSSYEDNYLAGLAFSHDFVDLGLGFYFGAEIGGAGRFGGTAVTGASADGSSAEIWGGPSLRWSGVDLGPLRISAGLTVGFSYVTDPIGRERQVELENNGDATFLYYAGPEIAFSFGAIPDTEFVFQTHHRSGGKNVPFLPTINNMPNTSNANIFGIRKRF